MKPWTDLAVTPMPPRVAALPRDERGYPIPATAFRNAAGVPDFRVIDAAQNQRLMRSHRCGICGEVMGKYVAFVGGKASMASRCFYDIGMHKECAEYALKTCPFLAAPKFAYTRALAEPPEGVAFEELSGSTDRPRLFGLGITREGYVQTNIVAGKFLKEPVIRAGEWHTLAWWMGGKEVNLKDFLVQAAQIEAGL